MQNTQNSQAAGLASKEELWPVQSQPAASNRRMDQGVCSRVSHMKVYKDNPYLF